MQYMLILVDVCLWVIRKSLGIRACRQSVALFFVDGFHEMQFIEQSAHIHGHAEAVTLRGNTPITKNLLSDSRREVAVVEGL